MGGQQNTNKKKEGEGKRKGQKRNTILDQQDMLVHNGSTGSTKTDPDNYPSLLTVCLVILI